MNNKAFYELNGDIEPDRVCPECSNTGLDCTCEEEEEE